MKTFTIAAFILLALAANSYAIAVGSPFLQDDTLKIPESHSGSYTIVLQNIEESNANLDVILNSEIAEIVDKKDVYVVPAGVTDYPVTFKITQPEGAKLGDVYTVTYEVKSKDIGGGLPMSLGLTKSFKVEIVKNPEKLYFGIYLREKGLLWAMVFAVLIGYAWYVRNERKKKHK